MSLILPRRFIFLALALLPMLGLAAEHPEEKEVPNFELLDIYDNSVSLASFRGNVVLINFWATWCPPCIEELPSMNDLKIHFSDQPFAVLAINMAEDKETILNFLERAQLKVDFPILVDPAGITADNYAVQSLPATLVIDKNGVFAFGGIGARDWNSEQVQSEILPLFD
jgi:peroxiredoxin